MTTKFIGLEHIGNIIKEELLGPFNVTSYRVCKDTGIPQMTLNNILNGKRALSFEVALKLGKYFAVDPKYLLNIQTELEVRRKERELIKILDNIQPLQMASVI